VEGGYSDAMRKIILASKNITDLFLSLKLTQNDSSKGLCSSISSLNPVCLTIWDHSANDTNLNPNSRRLSAEIVRCIREHWRALVKSYLISITY
jgi:hypothetical protein